MMMPLEVDSMTQDGHTLSYRRDGGAFFVTLPVAPKAGDRKTLTVYYHTVIRRNCPAMASTGLPIRSAVPG